MRKILIITPTNSYGGIEKVSSSTSKILSKKYNVINIYLYKSIEFLNEDGFNTICLNTPPSKTVVGQIFVMLKRNFLLARLKKKLKPDISFSLGEIASISNALTKQNEYCITSFHGYSSIPTGHFRRLIYRYILRKSSRLLCCSDALTHACTNFMAPSGLKIQRIYNPFDINDIQQKSNLCAPTLTGDPILFCYGRFVESKNFELTIEAFSLITKEFPKSSLYIMGSGELKESLVKATKLFDVEHSVCFLPPSDNPFPYLRQAHLLLCSSRNEGFGNTIVEGLACGVPVISTDCKFGPREILAPNTDYRQITDVVEMSEFGCLIPPLSDKKTPPHQEQVARFLASAAVKLLRDTNTLLSYRQKGVNRAMDFDITQYEKELQNILEV